MSKKYYRFFWGFLKKQEKWLNKMADKGCRLVCTGRAWYEFEDCEPGKYRVLFKNLNLDYSVVKAVFRPWAKKDGKIATTGGTYNKELLLVEKENDGKAFELHTTEEDIQEYQKTVRKPWIFSIATILIVILIAFGSVYLTKTLEIASTGSATRIGYVGNEGWSSWTGRYSSLDGTMKKSIHPEADVLHIEVKTDSGTISIEIEDADGNIIFDESDIGTASFDLDVSKKVTVKIVADHHKGSFSIE